MVNYFNEMRSNSVAGSSAQTYFCTQDENKEYTSRVFYKISSSGEFDYSFLFQSITDSSFPVENVSSCNMAVVGWEIVKGLVAVCKRVNNDINDKEFKSIYFNGCQSKKVSDASFFYTDKIRLSVKKGEYICLQITYKGKNIPHHHENTIPAFKLENGGWVESNQAVFASMIGCNRPAKLKIAYLGDSITQGIGVENNSYENWCAVLSEKLGDEYSFWNLGIGFGMANDCATDKSWLYKAKQNDLAVVCFGVNDLARIKNVKTIKGDLLKIVTELKKNGLKVILQTIPPFNYVENKSLWKDINDYIKTELVNKVDCVFDNVRFLGSEENEAFAKYIGHPNKEGCKVWADNLYSVILDFLK